MCLQIPLGCVWFGRLIFGWRIPVLVVVGFSGFWVFFVLLCFVLVFWGVNLVF